MSRSAATPREAAAGPGADGGAWTLVYDGDCALCRRTVDRIRDWDRSRRLETVPYQADGVSTRFPDTPMADFESAVQLFGPRGGRWHGADAVERVLTLIPRARPLAWPFRLPFARPIARRLYRLVARNRGRLGCGRHCPTG